MIAKGQVGEGEQFPTFSLPDEAGSKLSLSDLVGEPLIIYFYPKDDTSG